METIKLATLFLGIGAPEQGAGRVYDKVNTVFACEFDKFARQSYEANYDINPKHFHKDVHDLDATQYKGKVDVLVGGSPCQAFSIAGLRKGTNEERGQLIYQYIRVVEECMPEIIIYENVKGMLSIDNGNTVKEFVQALRDIGYHCHYDVLNTKEYGVPQNRERLYLVGFLDADLYRRFNFAPIIPLGTRLKDILEEDVDEKYYLSDKGIRYVTDTKRLEKKFTSIGGDVAQTLMSQYSQSMTGSFIKIAGRLDIKGADQIKRVYDPVGVSPTLTTMRGGGQEPKICEKRTDVGLRFFKDNVCGTLRTKDSGGDKMVIEPKIVASRGRNPMNPNSRLSGEPTQQHLEIDENGTSNCLTSVQKDNNHLLYDQKIRKLTPREYLRLQDFPDDFKIVVSDSQAYKQAGNSMSVNILEMIFNQIEKAKRGEGDGSLFDFMEVK